MKNRKLIYLILILVMLIGSSQVLGEYRITWYTIDGGGGLANGGQFSLNGTTGQPDAGYSRNSSYELLGGFWTGGPLCIVNFRDFANFAWQWLDTPCNAGNNFCGGADLNQSGEVNTDDLAMFAEEWLYCCPAGWLLK